jgi:glycosyltransferase involved in cell wall biosynthesis
MKILFVTKNYRPGAGDRTYMFNLERLLREHGHQVAYFAMDHPLNIPSQFSKYFVSQIDFAKAKKMMNLGEIVKVLSRSFYSFESRDKMKAILEDFRPDIVHIHHLDAHISLSILPVIKSHGVPIVWTQHIYTPLCINYNLIDENTGNICEACRPNKFYQATVKRCKKNSLFASFTGTLFQYFNSGLKLYDYTDHFLFPSEFIRNKFINWGFPSYRSSKLTYFYDSRKIKPVFGGEGYGLFFGRLVPEKGVDFILRALKGTGIPFKIVGDGPSRKHHIEFAKKLGLENIEFTGYKSGNELFRIISGANFIVAPSVWYEVVGLVIVEAFSYGKPAIGSYIGGIPEVITDGETGFLFEHTSPEDLREKMLKLYLDPEMAIQMGKQARSWVERVYSPQLHYTKLMDHYSSLI